MSIELKEYRIYLELTAKEASIACKVPLRTYIRYESDSSYGDVLKRNQMLSLLKDKHEITEEKDVLTIGKIKNIVNKVLIDYENEVSFCYLFDSYAK